MGLTQWLAHSQGSSETTTALAPGTHVSLDISLERLTSFGGLLQQNGSCLVRLEATGNGLSSLAGIAADSLVAENDHFQVFPHAEEGVKQFSRF